MMASPSKRDGNLQFFVPDEFLPVLVNFPWQESLEKWQEHGLRLLEVKSGLSRHVVRFVQANSHRFAIKETSLESARREYATYVRLREMDIHTLWPVGFVARNDGTRIIETKVGRLPQERHTGFLITELMEKVVPDSFLFRRGFSKNNRRRIWDAVIRLFVEMHSQGVYWGDASLANMLINFSSEIEPELGRRTRLRAILADAETVEIHRSITDSLRLADVEFFLESMQWTEADLRASGIVRDAVMTDEDQEFILETYHKRFAVEQEMRSFELMTHIDVDKLLGDFDVKGYARVLLKHINEHKWYISERLGREVSLVDAAEEWYRDVFQPVCKVFLQYDVADFFPEKTAASLYVEIMEHKYLLSEKAGNDVGLIVAARDFVENKATRKLPQPIIRSIIRELRALFKRLPPPLQAIYS
ncbi:DUF4032 domain-containing protein [Sphingobacteriales bacterium CHB3]|nr:DUF4032 domain-containing protein [Sphingobacteriales bacterium CHB3]